ncbi:hypothetical protein OAO87_01475 [bacterium]|nr:hypothetical protein [bacterium]
MISFFVLYLPSSALTRPQQCQHCTGAGSGGASRLRGWRGGRLAPKHGGGRLRAQQQARLHQLLPRLREAHAGLEKAFDHHVVALCAATGATPRRSGRLDVGALVPRPQVIARQVGLELLPEGRALGCLSVSHDGPVVGSWLEAEITGHEIAGGHRRQDGRDN